MNIIFPYTIYVDKGRLPNRGKYGKIKDLGRIPAWRRGISGKIPVCEQKH
jgi:hypothetical protein